MKERGVGKALCVTLMMAIVCVADLSLAVAAQPSAQEILDKSQKAMGPPIQYRMRTGMIELMVYQKVQSNGSLACRTESTLPVARTAIVVGDESFEFYPDKGVVIETTFMIQTAKSHAAAISAVLAGAASSSAKLMGTVMRKGKECFIIESTFSEEAVALVSKSLSSEAKKMMPVKNRLLIDKESYLTAEVEAISQAGTTISKTEYTDVERRSDLPDDLFLVPDGMDIQKPKSIQEYVALLGQLVAVPPKQVSALPTPAILPLVRPSPLEIDPKTGLVIPPAPPGMSRGDFDALVAQKLAEIRSNRPEQEPIGMGWGRKTAIVCSLLAIVGLLTVIALRRARKLKYSI